MNSVRDSIAGRGNVRRYSFVRLGLVIVVADYFVTVFFLGENSAKTMKRWIEVRPKKKHGA